jgi:hypothetical protein
MAVATSGHAIIEHLCRDVQWEAPMNRIMTEYYPMFQMYQSLRDQLMDMLADEELGFTPGGANPALGELCREIGETERNYIDSLKTFTMSFVYGTSDSALAGSVAALKRWYAELDAELRAVVEALTDEEIASRVVDRGHGFRLPPNLQLDVYKEALLIFYGKAAVYLKAMGKTPTEQWRHWIA